MTSKQTDFLMETLSTRIKARLDKEGVPSVTQRFRIQQVALWTDSTVPLWYTELTDDNVQDLEDRYIAAMKIMEGWNR